jgi:hypothetical protein
MTSFIDPSKPGMGLVPDSSQSTKPTADKPNPEKFDAKIDHEKWHDTTEALLKTSSFGDAAWDPFSTLSIMMGDSFIRGMSTNKDPLDTSSFLTPALTLLPFLKAKIALLQSRDENCELAKSLIKASTMLEGSDQFFKKISGEKIDELCGLPRAVKTGFREKVDFIVERIKSLKPGEEMLIPGGWEGTTSHHGFHYPRQHDMLYVLRRQPDDRFTMSVITLVDDASSSVMPNGAYKGLKYKIKPVRIFPNLPAEMVLNPEPWAAYMKMMFVHSEWLEDYSFKDLFSDWLKSLGSTEELDASALEALNIDETTLQRTEVATADAYFQWLRTMMPSKALYKTLKLQFKAWLLAQGLATMKKDKLFDPAVSIEDINDKKKKLQIARGFIEKFSISVKKSLERDELTVHEAEQYLTQVRSYLKEIKKADRLLNQTHEKLSIDRAKDLIFKSTSTLKLDGENCKEEGAPEIISKKMLDIKTTWQEPASLLGQLQSWHKILSSAGEDRLQVHLTLFKIFKEMPSIGDAYWDAIPEMHREECMVVLSELSELFSNTASEVKNTKTSRIEYMCVMQQTLAVVKKLSMGILDKENPIFIDTSYFTHADDENGLTGYPFIRNPILEKKLKDTVSFFRDPHKKERNLMCSGSIVKNLTHPDFNRISPIHSVNGAGIKFNPEQLYVTDYLKKHPEVREKILTDLARDEGDLPISEHLIIAKALIGDNYLPKAFYALRMQAYITQFFCTYPYYHDYSKV